MFLNGLFNQEDMVDTTCFNDTIPYIALSLAAIACFCAGRRMVINEISDLEENIEKERNKIDPNEEHGKYNDITIALQILRNSNYQHLITGYRTRKNVKEALDLCNSHGFYPK